MPWYDDENETEWDSQTDRATWAFLVGLSLGSIGSYLLDPDRGVRRRHLARDRSLALLRRGARQGAHMLHALRADLHAMVERQRHRGARHLEVIDDVTLAHRVESELFRDPDFGRGVINLNAQFGVIVLRGQLHAPELIHRVEDAVRRIEGVRDVINLTHLPNTPAPNKRASLETP